MKKFLLYLALISSMQSVNSLTLRIACRAKGIELSLIRELVDEWTKESGVDVEIISLPHASNECFALYKQLLSSSKCDLDLVAMDVAWINAFADKLENLYDYEEINSDITDDYFDAIRSTLVNNGKLIALSLYTDVGVLFYRKDLLEKYNRRVPQTFDELYATAYYIQNAEREAGNKHIYGYVFSGKAAEGLMCVANEVVQAFGGKFANEEKCTLDSDKFQDAMKFLVKCVKDICPVGIPNHNEEDSRGIFQIGNAVFMRNWPYAAVVADNPDMKGKVGMTCLPAGTLGGWNLGVPSKSTNKQYSVSLLKHLTSRKAQKMRAVKGHYAPAYKSLYCECDVTCCNPMFCSLKDSLQKAYCRPSTDFGGQYQKASTIFVSFLNTALSKAKNKKYDLEGAIKTTNQRLDMLLKKNKKVVNNGLNREKGK